MPAGVYRGTVRVSTDKGKAELPVTLTVWDFDLPDGPTHCNHFGGFWGIASVFGVKYNSDEFREIEARYCEAMAEHRLNPPLPSRLLPQANPDGSLTIDTNRHEALRAFIEKLHVTDFEIPSSPFGRLPHSTTNANYKTVPPDQREKALRYYRDYYQYVKSNGWADRAYVYLLDEPNTAENYEQVLVLAEIVHRCARVEMPRCRADLSSRSGLARYRSGGRHLVPALVVYRSRDGQSETQARRFRLVVHRAGAAVARYHPAYEEVREKDPPYWHIDRPLLVYRVPTWINRQYGITGCFTGAPYSG